MEIREFLRARGLPPGDLHDLPDSAKRFPDGAQYRVEIPSTERPRCLEAVLATAEALDVRVHRVSQGSGVFMHTDAELEAMASTAAACVEVSLFARPDAAHFVTTRKTLEAVGRRGAFGTNLDPSHFAHQSLDAMQRAET